MKPSNKENYKYSELTERIIGEAFEVYNVLGYGFLEKVYQNAMLIRLNAVGLKAIDEYPIKVHFEGEVIGDFFADILVDDKVIVELKAIEVLNPIHEVQLVNYLKATNIEVGLLINFGKRLEIKRKVFNDSYKAYGIATL